jgi:23S rRNA (uracil1939-C5)-methyltransferase
MDLKIEKLVYGGDGLARMEQADGKRKTVFVPLVLPGERVEATVVEDRPGFARAKLERVIEPAPYRGAPPCPYFGECGGCHYQHAVYEEQLRLKQEVLRETVARIAKIELPEIVTHPSPPLHYRNRTRMKVERVTNGDTKFRIGYYRLASHRLLPVKECPISSPLINRAVQEVWSLAADHEVPPGWMEIEFFADHEDRRLLVEFLTAPNADGKALRSLAEEFQKSVPEIVGVAAVPSGARRGELIAAPELDDREAEAATVLVGQSHLDYDAGGFRYRVSAGSFFQANRFLTDTLVKLACDGAEGRLAMDLYAGVGLFALPLAKDIERVIAVESAPASFADLKANVPPHVKAVHAMTESFLERAGQKPDFVVVDPPRTGLGKKVVEGLARLAPKRLAYVSCDPSTMARDLPGLVAKGYRITQAHMIDLFPQTFHIETVLRMER